VVCWFTASAAAGRARAEQFAEKPPLHEAAEALGLTVRHPSRLKDEHWRKSLKHHVTY